MKYKLNYNKTQIHPPPDKELWPCVRAHILCVMSGYYIIRIIPLRECWPPCCERGPFPRARGRRHPLDTDNTNTRIHGHKRRYTQTHNTHTHETNKQQSIRTVYRARSGDAETRSKSSLSTARRCKGTPYLGVYVYMYIILQCVTTSHVLIKKVVRD